MSSLCCWGRGSAGSKFTVKTFRLRFFLKLCFCPQTHSEVEREENVQKRREGGKRKLRIKVFCLTLQINVITGSKHWFSRIRVNLFHGV